MPANELAKMSGPELRAELDRVVEYLDSVGQSWAAEIVDEVVSNRVLTERG